MQINHRKIRRTLGSRVIRRNGTKLNTSSAGNKRPGVRPKTRVKNIIRDIRSGKIEHP